MFNHHIDDRLTTFLDEFQAPLSVGSVGQPRRLGDNRASYVLYDGADLEFRRVEYSWIRTAANLAAIPFDDEQRRELVERLEQGI